MKNITKILILFYKLRQESDIICIGVVQVVYTPMYNQNQSMFKSQSKMLKVKTSDIVNT